MGLGAQYGSADPLETRIRTHQLYSERRVDLDLECARALALSCGDGLLDVGCGPGGWPIHLRGTGHRGRLVGLDQSRGMLDEAKKRMEAAGIDDIEWMRGDAGDLPFSDGAFDAVSARHMLYHVPDIPKALSEMARVVKPGGKVMFTTNSINHTPIMKELRGRALAHLGRNDQPEPVEPFNIENARAVLGRVFGEIDETIIANAFVFHDIRPPVDYVMSIMSMFNLTGEELDEAEAWLVREAAIVMAKLGGTWRDPKDNAVYVCRV